jgi:TonB family protein
MPLNVRRLSSSIFLVLFILGTFALAQTQQVANQPSPVPVTTTPVKAPTAGEIMRDRISKAKAFIAVRNYNAATYELEMIRRETSDQSVQAVTNILLMNSYLEQGNYKKAQDFLSEFYKNFKAGNANASTHYSAVAAQIVKGARSQVERYRALGLSVSDRNLPLEAVNDIEKMRETLELVITQTKETSADKARSAVAMPLLEEATSARSTIGRDEYDSKRWRDAGDDAREQVATSQSVVINATDGTTVPQSNEPAQTSTQSAAKPSPEVTAVAGDKKPDKPIVPITSPPDIALQKSPPVPVRLENPKKSAEVTTPAPIINANSVVAAPPVSVVNSGPVEVGSLLAYASKQAPATYPPAARSMRTSGVVKVEVVVDEKGDVSEVKKADGPALLQAAAKDAVKKWKFRPVMRDGQAVRATGFISFNFTL